MGFPPLWHVRQKLKSNPLEDPSGALDAGLSRAGFDELCAGKRRVAVGVGSRKIDGLQGLVSSVVARLRKAGCEPFVVPAMGSHGGARPEGQLEVLRALGITEESISAPIDASMETVLLGRCGGADVYTSRTAFTADAIVILNRVSPHTLYSGEVQSGLLKMLVVGLGKREGARSLHGLGDEGGRLIAGMANVVLEKTMVMLGIAVVEDGRKRISRLEVMMPDEIGPKEPFLLGEAISLYPRIPLERADILIVDEMGKDISGIGMDPLVTGRGKETAGENSRFRADRLVVLRLSGASGGNATGIGHADVTTEGLVGAIDREVTYRNVMTTGLLHRARVPLVARTEMDAVSIALESLGGVPVQEVRLVRIANTGKLEGFEVSGPVAEELRSMQDIEVGDTPRDMEFDDAGNML